MDGDVFDEADKTALQPLTDWRIVVSAPLVIENTLPISGSYIVWELPGVQRLACGLHLHRSHEAEGAALPFAACSHPGEVLLRC